MQNPILKSAVITLLIALTIAAMVWAAEPRFVGIRRGRADENYLDSEKCQVCHPDHYQSWARTYHSRMTEEASAKSVLGDFERENNFEYLGVKARMEKRDGHYTMALKFPDGRNQILTIERTVGSRRIQQYVTRQNGQYTRLPLAYDLVNRRWMSLNGSFFHADSENYFQHQTTWDANCVFCHNVKAQPNMNGQTRQFATEVTELGIACGACHGRGAKHVEEASSPWTRTWWRLTGMRDKQIVQPEKLTSERSLMICGHCHGQRVPEPIDRIQQILTHGDPYNAGEDLTEYYRPVSRETKVGEYSFANRFWNNGSPRLTAYEYQGILRSQCFVKGEPGRRINCLSCHSMHEGDPKGQIRPENRTDQPCLKCHQQFSAQAALNLHTKHRTDSIGSRCYNCHMPRVVYGIMSFHPTHEITVPDPGLTAARGVPNACNQCHLDRSVNWAIAESKRLWPLRYGAARLSKDEMFDLPEGPRALFAGDALVRALAAEALSSSGPMKIDPLWSSPFLIEALTDNYPIVRFFAAQGLAAHEAQRVKLDYLGNLLTRQRAYDDWWQFYSPRQPSVREDVMKLVQMMRQRRINVDLEVGE